MMPLKYFITDQLRRRNNLLLSSILRQLTPLVQNIREKKNSKSPVSSSVSSLFEPVRIKPKADESNVGEELTGTLKKSDIIKILNTFAHKESVINSALKYGLDNQLLSSAMSNFRRYCVESESLPVDLHVILSDIVQGAGNVTDIFPYFLRFAKQTYPHIDCIDDLKKISDLRNPPNWYPIARAKKRKIVFHAGPTNSGKTYHALQKLMAAKSGVYCGPLKLLANEVFSKSNANGTPCDLITGEERRYAKDELSPANHVACSVEMVNVQNVYEIAVIDEIQLIRDPSRGWAWSRALLGIAADEIHLCGESAAIPIVNSICETMNEVVEVREYQRLTSLEIEDQALHSLNNVKPGDCIVCFNKNDIFTVSQSIENLGKKVAVIYGSLPPGTKLAQAEKFNDVNDPCKILVATNAIGMGLNLHIRRIIFYSLSQPIVNETGEKEIDTISISSALQIAGRAGRYGTQWSQGYVTTFKADDLLILKKLLSQKPEEIKKAGLHPTADQIELYAYYLPNTSLSNLINIFVALCQVDDSLYFICNLDDFKFLADMIQHIPLALRTRYVFCCAPINRKMPFVCSMFLKYARQCSKNDKVTIKWLCQQIDWPLNLPSNISDLVHLECVFDVLDTYLWLSYRFPDLFPDGNDVREVQKELDKIIEEGIHKLKILFQKSRRDTEIDEEAFVKSNNSELPSTDLHLNRVASLGKGKLTSTLISQGLLTPEMLKLLQMEWAKKQPSNKSRLDNTNYHQGNTRSMKKPRRFK